MKWIRAHASDYVLTTSSVRFIPGMLVVLFFKCMSALFNPVYRRGEGINWGLVSFTVVMFSLATVCTAMNLDINSISYIDNREYPGDGGTAPGPLGYIATVFYKAINIVPNTAFVLNNWLADGLLASFLFDAAFPRPGV